jgi:hypothetical protein
VAKVDSWTQNGKNGRLDSNGKLSEEMKGIKWQRGEGSPETPSGAANPGKAGNRWIAVETLLKVD